MPIADRHLEYAESVRQALADAGLRAEVDDRSERMQLKLRDAQEQKIPVMAVVGDRDAEAGAVSPRLRTGESSQGVPLDEFVADLRARDASRELWPVAADAGCRRERVTVDVRCGTFGHEMPGLARLCDCGSWQPWGSFNWATSGRCLAVACPGGNSTGSFMRKMRGVGQLALLSTNPPRVAEFYESAFGFRRVAADEGGVDLELGGFELSFRRGETADPRGHPDRLQGRDGRGGRRLGAGARPARLRPGGAAVRRPLGGQRAASASPIPMDGRSPSSTTIPS